MSDETYHLDSHLVIGCNASALVDNSESAAAELLAELIHRSYDRFHF